MSKSKSFPGTPRHQEMLQTITDFYEEDERVLAVLLFGSLGRGNWDQYSDLDLDIVMTDNNLIDACTELHKLCKAIKQKHGFEAIIIADVEEGDVVLSNLVEFSIRYHVLSDTKPAILDTMHSLSGSLSLDEIRAFANDAYKEEPKGLVEIVNEYLRYALGLHTAIKRDRLWMALEMLHRMRASLMSMVAVRHDAIRSIHFFDAEADSTLQALLFSLTPQADLKSVEKAFKTAIRLLEDHLVDFCGKNFSLTMSQQYILDELKQLQINRGKRI
jgi:predicted nucleotidyltransferase